MWSCQFGLLWDCTHWHNSGVLEEVQMRTGECRVNNPQPVSYGKQQGSQNLQNRMHNPKVWAALCDSPRQCCWKRRCWWWKHLTDILLKSSIHGSATSVGSTCSWGVGKRRGWACTTTVAASRVTSTSSTTHQPPTATRVEKSIVHVWSGLGKPPCEEVGERGKAWRIWGWCSLVCEDGVDWCAGGRKGLGKGVRVVQQGSECLGWQHGVMGLNCGDGIGCGRGAIGGPGPSLEFSLFPTDDTSLSLCNGWLAVAEQDFDDRSLSLVGLDFDCCLCAGTIPRSLQERLWVGSDDGYCAESGFDSDDGSGGASPLIQKTFLCISFRLALDPSAGTPV